jgi:phosphoglycolate phosphatase
MPFRNGIKKLIAFDWNGTLLADARIIFACTNKILQQLGQRTIDIRTYRDGYDIPIEKFYVRLGLSADIAQTHPHIVNHMFYEHYEKMAAGARLRRGAKEVLGLMQRTGAHAVILSNHYVQDIERHMERLAIKPYISAVLANEGRETHKRRPKGDRLMHFMKQYGVAPADVMIVGDSHEETEIAHALGVTSVAITDGHVSTPRLKQVKPHYLINNLREMEYIMREQGMC